MYTKSSRRSTVTPGLFLDFYLLCGLSDVLDGAIARRTGTVSRLGERLDTIADIVFVAVWMTLFIPVINVGRWVRFVRYPYTCPRITAPGVRTSSAPYAFLLRILNNRQCDSVLDAPPALKDSTLTAILAFCKVWKLFSKMQINNQCLLADDNI